jgi:hypothetical protein
MAAFFILPIAIFAQTSGSLQKVTVTSVTLTMDSVKTAADAELVKAEIMKHKEVRDFDIKKTNCNFTLDNSGNVLDVIFSDLAQRGQPARVYAIEANQTFTIVPEESCMSKKDTEVKEDKSKLGQPVDGNR